MKTLENFEALELIKLSLQSGAIKLQGSATVGTISGSEEHAAIDATYLLTLYSRLQGDTKSK
jgi:hypothetical protein